MDGLPSIVRRTGDVKRIQAMISDDSDDTFTGPAAASLNTDGSAPVLLVCDHASNALPVGLGTLGVSAAALKSHIAFDPGAAALTATIARQLGAAYIFGGYSRLLIDVNRPPEAGDSIIVENDGVRVPANEHLSDAERERRVRHIYIPYHETIERALQSRLTGHGTQLVVAVHSFTPRLRNDSRPWDIGLIFNHDRRLARYLVAELVEVEDDIRLTVGLNEPYHPDDGVYHTLARHAEARGLPCVMVEVRNDHLAGDTGRVRWGDRLAAALARCLPALAQHPGGAAVQPNGDPRC